MSPLDRMRALETINSDLAKTYRANGFVTIDGLLKVDELDALRNRTQEIAEGRVPGYPVSDIELEPNANAIRSLTTVRKLNRCAQNDPIMRAYASDDRILNVVEMLIGPDIKLFDSQCFMKPPGGIEKPYHQDSAYFSIEPMDLVTCWIALDQVTIENGCMWVIPGSHRHGLVNHGQPWFVGDRQDRQVPSECLDRDSERPIALTAGSCSFHHSLLLHRSAPNRTNTHRRGLAFHYMTAKSRWTHPSGPKPNFRLLRGRERTGCV